MPTFSSKTPAEQLAEKTAKSLTKDELPSGLVDPNSSSNELYHYTTKEFAPSIEKKGLNLSLDGFVYTTPKADLTPLQAQIELSLSPNKGLPESLFKIDVKGLNGININPILGPRSVFGGMFGAGGGTEILFKQRIPYQYLIRIK
jgi:hypothetical protein